MIAVLALVAGNEQSTAQHPEVGPKRFIEPQLDRCTIVGDNHVLKPVKVISPRLDEYIAGNLRLTVDKSRIAAVNTSENRVAWNSQIPNGISVVWLGADEDAAYLLFNRMNPETEETDFEKPVTIHRLVLLSGEWLPSLVVGDKELESSSASYPANIVSSCLPLPPKIRRFGMNLPLTESLASHGIRRSHCGRKHSLPKVNDLPPACFSGLPDAPTMQLLRSSTSSRSRSAFWSAPKMPRTYSAWRETRAKKRGD